MRALYLGQMTAVTMFFACIQNIITMNTLKERVLQEMVYVTWLLEE